MGNVAILKPAHAAVYSNYFIVRLLETAGLPPGVVNFLPGDAPAISEVVLKSPDLAGLHFTGSTATFQHLWKQISHNLEHYRSYPRIVGETGGKDYIVAHESADPQALAVAIVRGGYEYQGQKCSAVSRVYVPRTMWDDVRERVLGMMSELRIGDPRDFRNFVNAVIDEKAFRKIALYIDHAKESDDVEILAGGEYSDEKGWFVHPTLVVARNPKHRLMCEEIFGPVVTVYVYDDEWTDALRLVNETSPYGLTGAVFARDQRAIRRGDGGAPALGGQLLHQRQAHGRRRRSAAVRRRSGQRHERQGGLGAQPPALGFAAGHQTDIRAAYGLSLPVHGRGVDAPSAPVLGGVAPWGPRRPHGANCTGRSGTRQRRHGFRTSSTLAEGDIGGFHRGGTTSPRPENCLRAGVDPFG